MRRTMTSDKRAIVLRWALSYLVVFILPLCIFMWVTLQSSKVLNAEVGYYNAISVRMIRERMDSLLDDVNDLVDGVATSANVRQVLVAGERSDVPSLTLGNVIDELSRLHLNRMDIGDFYLYFPTIDTIVDGSTYQGARSYFDTYLADTSLSYGQWVDLMAEHHRSYRIVDFFSDTPSGRVERILILRPLSFVRQATQYATVACVVDKDMFLSSQEEPVDDRHDLLIMDRILGSVLYNSSPSFSTDELPSQVTRPSAQSWEGSVETDTLMIAAIDSEVGCWKYIVVKDKDVYLGAVIQLRRMFFLCFFVCLFAGLGIVMVLVRRHWHNFDSALQQADLTLALPGPSSGPVSEYRYFSDAISSLQDRNEEMGGLLKQQRSTVQSLLLRGLVENSADLGETDDLALRQWGIVFQSPLFLVVVLQPDGSDSDENKKRLIAVDHIVLQYCNEEQVIAYSFSMEKHLGFILNPGVGETEGIYERTSRIIERSREEVMACLDLHVGCACSNLLEGVTCLAKAYQQAVSVLEYRERQQCDDMLFYRDLIESARSDSFTYTNQQELEIAEGIRRGNAGRAIGAIETVMRENLEAGISPRKMRYLLFNIAGTVIKVYNRLDARIAESLPEIIMPPILQSNDLQEAHWELEQIVRSICKGIEQVNRESPSGSADDLALYRRLIPYIGEQYRDKALSVSGIADALDISLVHLSRVFKKYHGSCLSEYINAVRVNHAKDMISDGHTLCEAADGSGFGSLRTFMRVFKNCEGITPGQFRTVVQGSIRKRPVEDHGEA